MPEMFVRRKEVNVLFKKIIFPSVFLKTKVNKAKSLCSFAYNEKH